MGHDPETYGCTVVASKPGYYRCNTAPRGHPGMEYYALQSEPGIGICWVKGIGKDIDTSRFGTSLIAETDKIAQQVGKKYGRSEQTDYLRVGSIWDDPEDWMMGVYKSERFYSYKWEGNSQLIENHLKTIFVGATASGTDKGFVGVEFAYTNESECEKARSNKDGDAF